MSTITSADSILVLEDGEMVGPRDRRATAGHLPDLRRNRGVPDRRPGAGVTATEEQADELKNVDPRETRPAGRWMAAGVPTEKAKEFRSTLRRLISLLGSEPLRIGLVVLSALVGVVLNVFGPRVLGHATDLIIEGVIHHKFDMAHLHRVLLEAVLLYAGSFLLQIVTSYTLAGIIQRLMQRLRRAVEDKVHALPLSYIDRGSRGDLLSRVTNDIDNIAQTLQQTLRQMLTSVMLILGVGIMLFNISPLLAAVALTTLPVSVFTMRRIARRARPQYTNQWRSTGAVNSIVEEAFCTGHAIAHEGVRPPRRDGSPLP